MERSAGATATKPSNVTQTVSVFTSNPISDPQQDTTCDGTLDLALCAFFNIIDCADSGFRGNYVRQNCPVLCDTCIHKVTQSTETKTQTSTPMPATTSESAIFRKTPPRIKPHQSACPEGLLGFVERPGSKWHFTAKNERLGRHSEVTANECAVLCSQQNLCGVISFNAGTCNMFPKGIRMTENIQWNSFHRLESCPTNLTTSTVVDSTTSTAEQESTTSVAATTEMVTETIQVPQTIANHHTSSFYTAAPSSVADSTEITARFTKQESTTSVAATTEMVTKTMQVPQTIANHHISSFYTAASSSKATSSNEWTQPFTSATSVTHSTSSLKKSAESSHFSTLDPNESFDAHTLILEFLSPLMLLDSVAMHEVASKVLTEIQSRTRILPENVYRIDFMTTTSSSSQASSDEPTKDASFFLRGLRLILKPEVEKTLARTAATLLEAATLVGSEITIVYSGGNIELSKVGFENQRIKLGAAVEFRSEEWLPTFPKASGVEHLPKRSTEAQLRTTEAPADTEVSTPFFGNWVVPEADVVIKDPNLFGLIDGDTDSKGSSSDSDSTIGQEGDTLQKMSKADTITVAAIVTVVLVAILIPLIAWMTHGQQKMVMHFATRTNRAKQATMSNESGELCGGGVARKVAGPAFEDAWDYAGPGLVPAVPPRRSKMGPFPMSPISPTLMNRMVHFPVDPNHPTVPTISKSFENGIQTHTTRNSTTIKPLHDRHRHNKQVKFSI
jgi:hypothetical protein